MNTEKLLSVKELASELGRERMYVFAMKRRGFNMPGNRATLSAAREWLQKNPKPRARIIAHHGASLAPLVSVLRPT